MSEKDTHTIIENVIQLLEREREMYGDFSVFDRNLSIPDDQSKSNSENSGEKDTTTSVTKQNSDQPSTSSMTYFDPEDKLFSSSKNRGIYDRIANCNTLDELESLCQKADVLETDLDNTKLVFGVGNPQADLMLIGEAPGAEEDKQGEPFVGRAGKLLNKIIAAINFDRDDIYIANILKHRPPKNRNPKPEERERSLPFLLRQMDLIDPKLILCLGRVSANTLLDNNKSLGSMREQFHSYRDKYELMATYHPAALLRNPNWKRPTWEDVQLLRDRYDELGGKP